MESKSYKMPVPNYSILLAINLVVELSVLILALIYHTL